MHTGCRLRHVTSYNWYPGSIDMFTYYIVPIQNFKQLHTALNINNISVIKV